MVIFHRRAVFLNLVFENSKFLNSYILYPRTIITLNSCLLTPPDFILHHSMLLFGGYQIQ